MSTDGTAAFIARSNPYHDLRPFIESLWTHRRDMCCSIYPDQFPRGETGGASKKQEDDFLLGHFTPREMRLHGGCFLKQALYSIAKYNEDRVLEFAGKWARDNREYFEDPSMLSGMCGEVAEIKNFFDAEESAKYPKPFLSRVIIVIRYGLRQFSEQQIKPDAVATQASHAPAHVDGNAQALQDAIPPPLPTAVMAVAEPVASAMPDTGTSRAEAAHHVTPVVPSQPPSARLASHQLHRQEERGPSRRRCSGSMYMALPPVSPFPPFYQDAPPSNFFRGALSDYEHPLPMPAEAPPGYMPVGQMMALDPRFMSTSFAAPDQYGSSPHGRQMMAHMEPHIQRRSTGTPYYPRDNDSRPHGPMGSRASRGSFSNASRLVDPHSFTRYPGDRVGQQRPYAPKNQRRPSVPLVQRGRRFSSRSNEGWQAQRDRPFDGSTRRVYSDQPPTVPASALERKLESVDANTRPVAGDESLGVAAPSVRHMPSAPIEDDVSSWSCSEDSIGSNRIDVRDLVAGNIPPHLALDQIQEYLTREVNCGRISYAGSPGFENHDRVIFVNFYTADDARRALLRKDLQFRSTDIVFKVPYKFYRLHHRDYIPPDKAKSLIQAGIHPHSKPYRRFSNSNKLRPSRMYPSAMIPTAPGHSRFGSDSASSAPSFMMSTDQHAGVSMRNTSVPQYSPAFATSGYMTDTSHSEKLQSPLPALGDQSAFTLPSLSEASTPRKDKFKKNKGDTLSARSSVEALRDSTHVYGSAYENDRPLPSFDNAEVKNPADGNTQVNVSVSQAPYPVQESEVNTVPEAEVNTLPELEVNTLPESEADTLLDSPRESELVTSETSKPQEDDVAAHSRAVDESSVLDGSMAAADSTALVINTCEDPPTEKVEANAEAAIGSRSNSNAEATMGSRNTSSERRDFTEDIDESFQTAVETPESTKATIPKDLTGPPGQARATDASARIATAADAMAQSPATLSNTDTERTALASTSPMPEPAAQASKKSAMSKPGPRQTESLSPFARQVTSKKKESKQKPVKAKNKNKTETNAKGQHVKHVEDTTAESDTLSDKQDDVNAGKPLTMAKGQDAAHNKNVVTTSESNIAKNDAAATVASAMRAAVYNTTTTPTDLDEPLHNAESPSTQVFSRIRARLTAITSLNSSKAKVESNTGKENQPFNNALKLSTDQSTGSQVSQSLASAADTTRGDTVSNDSMSRELQIPSGLPLNLLLKSHAATGETDPTLNPQSTIDTSSPAKKQRKRKKKNNKKKSKTDKNATAAPPHDDDGSSSETLAHEMPSPAMGPSASVSSAEVTKLSLHGSGHGVRLGARVVSNEGYRIFDDSAYNASRDVLASGTNEQVEQSRMKLREMEQQEKLLKLRQKNANGGLRKA